MSEIRLVVRDAARDLYGNCHAAVAERFVAALSDDPETIEQLAIALERFEARAAESLFGRLRSGIDDRVYDAEVLLVDLAARLIVCRSTYVLPGTHGCVAYHDGEVRTDVSIDYHLADDWQITDDVDGWRALAEQRRRERLADPPLDARAVLYGRPLLEHIARACLTAFRGDPPAADDREPETPDRPREIHARWMLAPRDDLRGRTPREVIVAGHEHVDMCLQHRCAEWASMQRPPAPLDTSWPAYRFGGFGTHEIVTYYEMVRELIGACREAVIARTGPGGSPDLTAEEFVRAELPRLARCREEWLDTPNLELGGSTPRRIIHNERIRMPEAGDPEEAIVDPDCPLCQMQAELPRPMFWHLDGCNMDDDFAFYFHGTYDDWKEERREYEQWNRRFEAEQAERERLGVRPRATAGIDSDAAWDAEDAGSAGAVLYRRLFSVGASLCEITVALKEPPGRRDLLDRLCRDFGNLRDVCRTDDPASADALIEPVLHRFGEALDAVAADRPDLERQCVALQDRLARFLDWADPTPDAADGPDG